MSVAAPLGNADESTMVCCWSKGIVRFDSAVSRLSVFALIRANVSSVAGFMNVHIIFRSFTTEKKLIFD